MTAQVKIKVDMRRAQRFLTNVQKKQIPFATAEAITKTLQIARTDVIAQLDRDIDRPNPWTRRGFRVLGAKKQTLFGKLFVTPSQLQYMRFQIFGGVRGPQGQSLAIPPAKQMSGDLKRDRFGNIPRGQQARQQIAKGAFSATIGGVSGIWLAPKRTKTGKLRKGSRMKLLLAYESQAVYRPRFRFFEAGRRSINKHWNDQFNKSFRRAIRTAR